MSALNQCTHATEANKLAVTKTNPWASFGFSTQSNKVVQKSRKSEHACSAGMLSTM